MRIFIAGLSRSGKTSRAQHAAKTLPDADYVSVSQVLRLAGGIFPVHTVADFLANQRRAIEALHSVHFTSQHQLIDGHALIETNEGPCLVPDWFFDEFPLDMIVYVQELPENILGRRRIAVSQTSSVNITALGQIELAACMRTAARLSISLITLESPSLDTFVAKLRCNMPYI